MSTQTLHDAAHFGRIEDIERLLRDGAEATDWDWTQHAGAPIHYAAAAGWPDAARILLAHGARIHEPDVHHWTPLHQAAFNGRLEVAMVLLECGACVNQTNQEGETPLHLAVEGGWIDVIELLLLHGAIPTLKDKINRTPMDVALAKGQRAAIEVLSKHTAASTGTRSDSFPILHLPIQSFHSLLYLLHAPDSSIRLAACRGLRHTIHTMPGCIRTLVGDGIFPCLEALVENEPEDTVIWTLAALTAEAALKRGTEGQVRSAVSRLITAVVSDRATTGTQQSVSWLLFYLANSDDISQHVLGGGPTLRVVEQLAQSSDAIVQRLASATLHNILERDVSAKYWVQHYLDFHDDVGDLFYDVGRQRPFQPLSILRKSVPPLHPREVIVADMKHDTKLRALVTLARETMHDIDDMNERVRELLRLVCDVQGGGTVDIESSEQHLQEIKQNLGTGIVPLGEITVGVCRHRALLFKFLGDQLGIPTRLVRGMLDGTPHVWNVVRLPVIRTTPHLAVSDEHGVLERSSPEKNTMDTIVSAAHPVMQLRKRRRVTMVTKSANFSSTTTSEIPQRKRASMKAQTRIRRDQDAKRRRLRAKAARARRGISPSEQQQEGECSVEWGYAIVDMSRGKLVLDESEEALRYQRIGGEVGGGTGGHSIREELDFCSVNQLVKGDLLGKGGWGKVFAATSRTGHPYALKKIDMRSLTEDQVHCVEQEVVLHRQFFHPNIVQFKASWKEKKKALYILMERLGGSLHHLVRAGRLSASWILPFALDIARAMRYLHSCSIVHRDLKSANILVDYKNEVVKLADFGMSREYDGTHLTALGTLPYMAPELRTRSNYTPSHKVDVYSYGILLGELVMRRGPDVVNSYTMEEIACHSPHEAITEIFERCTREDPSERPDFVEIVPTLECTLADLLEESAWTNHVV